MRVISWMMMSLLSVLMLSQIALAANPEVPVVSTEQTQATEQEVKTAEELVQTSEEQLQVAEEQLQMAEEQLQVAEEQVHAAEELVQASGEQMPETMSEMPVIEPELWHQRKSLIHFTKSDQGRFLFLRQTQASHAFYISLPYRVKPEQMLVHLEFTNSNALLADRSQIMLRMNGGVFGQAHLDPVFPDGAVDVSVPLSMLQDHENEMAVEVAQHYLMECEDPGSPELWTSIDLNKSYVEFTGALKPVTQSLSEVDRILREPGWLPQTATLMFKGDDQQHLQAGSIISQGLSLRNTEHPLAVHARRWIDDQSSFAGLKEDVVLFGTREELADILGLQEWEKGALGQLIVKTLPGSPEHFLLGIVASDTQHLIDVAKAFAMSTAPFRNQDQVAVYEIQDAEHTAYSSHVAVMEGREYQFSDLGYETDTLKGLIDQTHMDVWIPADLFATSHMNVELKLHFSYGAALRADSVMNLFHNGKFIRGISLADPKGLSISDYKIKIPLASMRPGLNRFEFQSRMFPYTATNCMTGNTENLLFTLFEDSSISIPNTDRFVQMPEVNLLVTTGFPYTENHGEGSVIQVPSYTDMMLGSAWTLSAKLAQIREAIQEHLLIVNDANGYRDVIRLSTIKDVSEAFWENATINLGEKGFINHPTLANPNVLGRKTSQWHDQLERFLDASVSNAPEYLKRSSVVKVKEDVKLLNSVGLLQMENPAAGGGTLTMIVADQEQSLEAGVGRIIESWDQLLPVYGDLVIWGDAVQTGEKDFWHAHVEQHHYHIGSMPRWNRLSYFAIKYPEFLSALLFVLFVVMALITRWSLTFYRKKEHPSIEV